MKKWIGAIAGMVVSISGVMGPILGGIITHYTTWRWIFWIKFVLLTVKYGITNNFPVLQLVLYLLLYFLLAWPRQDQMRHAERRPLHELDVLGSFLLIAASVLCVFAFQESGASSTRTWATAIFIAPIVVGSFCWLALIGWEIAVLSFWQDSISAVLPSSLLKRRVYSAGALTTLFTGFPYFIVIYNVPLHFKL